MSKNKINPEIIKIITPDFAYGNGIVPLRIDKNLLTLGICNNNDVQLINDIEFFTGMQIKILKLTEENLYKELKKLYGEQDYGYNIKDSNLGEFEVVEKVNDSIENGELQNKINEISVVSLVNQIITNAIDANISDIHIEAYEGKYRVRYRRDGVLQEVMNPPMDKKQAIISRLKIMADLDIAEKRRPQDGRIRVKRDNHVIDIRVSTLPTDFGEKIVLRILDKSQLNLDLEKLGFEINDLKLFKRIAESPYGMILVTGPTGSGKTTTLYATLNYLNAPEVNILTIEDPIEYNLVGINQSQVKSDIGFSFVKALRSFLRQDPDIIMVGEIRDQETAEIAVRAALTGHLVLSTLHTNNAPDTLTRLLDMGQEPFLISSSVKIVIAQRLLRTICKNCKEVEKKPPKLDRLTKLTDNVFKNIKFYRGKGCEKCSNTGYLGRTAVFEIMPISRAIADAINRRATSRKLKEIACHEGMHSLQQSAINKLKDGITTVEEVLRETEF
jgi:type IV pilus assembly protein PilB